MLHRSEKSEGGTQSALGRGQKTEERGHNEEQGWVDGFAE